MQILVVADLRTQSNHFKLIAPEMCLYEIKGTFRLHFASTYSCILKTDPNTLAGNKTDLWHPQLLKMK